MMVTSTTKCSPNLLPRPTTAANLGLSKPLDWTDHRDHDVLSKPPTSYCPIIVAGPIIIAGPTIVTDGPTIVARPIIIAGSIIVACPIIVANPVIVAGPIIIDGPIIFASPNHRRWPNHRHLVTQSSSPADQPTHLTLQTS